MYRNTNGALELIPANRIGSERTDGIPGLRVPNLVAMQYPFASASAEMVLRTAVQEDGAVIDLTNDTDRGITATEFYYPTRVGETKHYSKLSITYRSEQSDGTKIYEVVDRISGITKTLKRYQFKEWPDHGTLGDPEKLATLAKRIDAFGAKTVFVHCRGGVGRTGTLLAAYITLHRLQAHKITADNVHKDVFDTVVHLRKQRGPLCVQTEGQYRDIVNLALARLGMQNREVRDARSVVAPSVRNHGDALQEYTIHPLPREKVAARALAFTYDTGHGNCLEIRETGPGMNWTSGPSLVWNEGNRWTLHLRGTQPFDYKIVFKRADGTVVFEEGANRRFNPSNTRDLAAPVFDLTKATAPRAVANPVPPPARPRDHDRQVQFRSVVQEISDNGHVTYHKVQLAFTYNTGLGNSLEIRGTGPGMSWTSSYPLTWTAGNRWVFDLPQGTQPFEYKVVIRKADGSFKFEEGASNRRFDPSNISALAAPVFT